MCERSMPSLWSWWEEDRNLSKTHNSYIVFLLPFNVILCNIFYNSMSPSSFNFNILLGLSSPSRVMIVGFPGSPSGKESACQCRRCERYRLDSWVRKIPWNRKWQPTTVFLTGKFHGQRKLVGTYSPWGFEELDMTKRLGTHGWE